MPGTGNKIQTTEEKIIEILYENSFDTGEGLVIDYSRIQIVKDKLTQLVEQWK